MKHSLLPLLLCAWVAPAFAVPKEELPPSIRAMTPKKIVSLRVFRVAPAPKAPQLLLHLWTVPKREFEQSGPDRYGSDVQSPFVLDVFTGEKKPRYRTSLILTANHAPTKVRLWYLDARTKEGLVFEVIDHSLSDEMYYRDTTTYFVIPFWPGTYQTSQTYKTNISSGNLNVYFTERDAQGMLHIIHNANAGGNPVSTHEVLTWEREEERFIVTQYDDYPRGRRWVWDRDKRQFVLAKSKAAPK